MGHGQAPIELSTGKLAKQADGSVVLKQGDTMLLATVVSSKEPKAGVDFLPLSVDYQEKYAATGRIPGGFMKREGKASDSEILVARLIDRALRPLFPDNFHAEVFVTVNLISADKETTEGACAFVSVHLNREHNIFKRIWTAIKYVFGIRCIYGDFDEVIINPNDADRLQKVVDFLKKHQE